MKEKAILAARILMGLIFVVFGTNGLMMILTGSGFIPMPPPSEKMMAVMGGFFGAGYLMPLVKILEIVGGLFLLTNNFVRLGLVMLTPVVINILGIHLFVDLAGLPMAALLTVMNIALIRSEWEGFAPLLKK